VFTFSYSQEIYDERREPLRRYLKWKNKEQTWTYPDCLVSVVGMESNRSRIVLRRKFSGYSKFMQSNFEVNLMMGFVATDVQKFNDSQIIFEVEQSSDRHHRDLSNVRISSDDKEVLDELYQRIQDSKNNPPKEIHIFSIEILRSSIYVPVIYQPRIDAWNYFLREINVHQNSIGNYEITLVFEDEVLRKNAIFNFLYRLLRMAFYRRTKDIETFYIDPKKEAFRFPGIYSDDDTLFDDSTHFDKEGDDGNIKYHKIKYYFQDQNHPIVFVNTSNHALAPHDNNHDLWKWEYIPWIDTIPIRLGNKTNEETEIAYRQF
jgi:hypothetical protein